MLAVVQRQVNEKLPEWICYDRRIVCEEFVSHAPLRETVHRALKHRAVERRTRGSLLKLCGLGRAVGYRDELPKSVPRKDDDDEARRKEKSVPIGICKHMHAFRLVPVLVCMPQFLPRMV